MQTPRQNSSGRLYRILDFSRAVQIFETNSLYFALPRTWDDPYEARINYPKSHAVFAQCWATIGTSDAMWRIYSPNHLGVRISTSTKKLSDAIRKATVGLGYKFQAKPVDYLTQRDLHQRTKEIVDNLKENYTTKEAVQTLFMKRDAFMHEAEWRAIVYCPKDAEDSGKTGISIEIKPHEVIDSILLDPRAPKELVDAFTFYFKEKIKFKKRVARSVLYKSPIILSPN